ncbi:MAG: alpha-glucan family phosphorylase [Trueperaceae bacterium]|nr:alpha-glucan family phosphorylase [Trueperaceae bacterium]MCO5172902.1 alpha-glucan family phosphorylase [Trueperaceae bacterium]MCW5819369.1 alpha-glucan family phosphorylase [Trueperaceae bacterium]
MNILGRLTLLPRLPEPLARLEELAHDLYWSWRSDARRVFRRLDVGLWEACGHNPVAMLRDIAQERLDAAALDPDFLAEYTAVMARYDAYLASKSWFDSTVAVGAGNDHLYAYLCAEYGWSEAIALYSGGLGVLAGDHTKAASDLGVPLVAVGLYYPEGYFHQRVGPDGRQEAVYQRSSPAALPFRPALDALGRRAAITVEIFGRQVLVQAWEVRVGKVRVLLLDVDVDGNDPADRKLLYRLYGGDQRTRVAQEMILGIGGVRMLRALDVRPTAWHMNEGHSAFSVLERCRELVAGGLPFPAARASVAAATVFTVHTPIAAGNDAFGFDLVDQGFGRFFEGLGLTQAQFNDLGGADLGWGPVFSMPALAIRFSSGRNGVAALHGDTSRHIWSRLWEGVPVAEVPIGHVTNGVHIATWTSPEIIDLIGDVVGPDWRERTDDPEAWRAFEAVPAATLWQVRRQMKARSVRFLRRRLLSQLSRHEASPTTLHDTNTLFDPDALTIGFARRFASYKRATLIFSDLDRLAAIMTSVERPVQLVFAGKAHPADVEGQQLIARIHNLSHDQRFQGRVLFVEDYDMAIGRALTRGVDVWLNNPRRPLEASGTSGMKAAMNGVLNLSILDGWWPEGFDGTNGWAIGTGRTYQDDARSDAADADALYDLLEREVVPLYYQRDAQGVPDAWMRRSAKAIATISPRFNAQRMVREYVESYYVPASERGAELSAHGHRKAIELAEWTRHVRELWPQVRFTAGPLAEAPLRIGDEVQLGAELHLGGLAADDVVVEIVYSREGDALEERLELVRMEARGDRAPDGTQAYSARFRPKLSGRLVYGARVVATNPLLSSPFDAHAIKWA